MFNKNIVLYLGSRIISAAGAFAAVTIFTRMAGANEYGHYLLIFAWGIIVTAFTTQWITTAYFGVYESKRLREYVASLYQLLILALAIAALGLIGAELLGFHDAKFVAAVFALVVGMTVYFSAFDAARTALKAQSASSSMILRVLLMLVFGTLSLREGGGAVGLAAAIMVAHLIAAIPCWIAIGGVDYSKKSFDLSMRILKYGWALMLSFGVLALGQNIDRLVLVHYMGVSALGPYGAVSELMRQCFAVFGEAILFSMITTAKQHSNDGNIEASTTTLRMAFNACLAIGTFGAAFFIVFGDRILQLVLPPDFHTPTSDLIPIFSIAYAFMMLGQYYFANVIFFTKKSHLAAISSATLVLISGILSVLLVPIYGPKGAAIGMLAAYVASCSVLIIVSQRYYIMPIDLAGFAEISLLAAIFVFLASLLNRFESNAAALLISQIAIFVALGGYAVHRYGLLQPNLGNLAGQTEKRAPARYTLSKS